MWEIGQSYPPFNVSSMAKGKRTHLGKTKDSVVNNYEVFSVYLQKQLKEDLDAFRSYLEKTVKL